MRIGWGWAAALAMAAAASGAAEAQSFNCRFARASDEVLICQNSGLGALDERLAFLYARRLRNSDDYERSDLQAEQARWLSSRRACGYDAACIRRRYLSRIDELN